MNVNTTRPITERPSVKEQLDRSGHLWYAEKQAREFVAQYGSPIDNTNDVEFAALVNDIYQKLSTWNINGHRFAVAALMAALVAGYNGH